jgi:hypothetical protein
LAQHRTRRTLSPLWPYGRSRSRARAARACSRTSRLHGSGYHVVRRSPSQPHPKPTPPQATTASHAAPHAAAHAAPHAATTPSAHPVSAYHHAAAMFESNSAAARAAAAERAAELQAATDGHVRRRPSRCLPPCALRAPSPSPRGSCPLRAGPARVARPARATAGRACTEARPALPPLTTKIPTAHSQSNRHKRRCAKSARREG